jgi:hypothetical protein
VPLHQADLLSFLPIALDFIMASSNATQPPVNDVPADARSVSDDSDSGNEEGWEDVEPDDESQPIVGLFSEQVFPDVRSMLQECKEKHNFDLLKIQKDLGMSTIYCEIFRQYETDDIFS